MNIGLLVIGGLTLLLFAAAAWLFTRAQARERGEELEQRLRVSGVDEAGGVLLLGDIRNPIIRGICRMFWRGGTEIQPAAVWRLLLILLVVAVLLAMLLSVLVALAATGLVLVLAYMVLAQRASRRRLKIVDQMPGFLDSAIRVLAAGNTFEESLVQAARESPDPIRPLFTSIGRQVRLGAPLEAVLAEAGEIHKLRDLKVISLAANINRRYGGSMRSVLRSLVVAIRQRGTAAKELRALTAETRFSAYVLAGVTLGIFIFLFVSNPKYYATMLATRSGTLMLAFSTGMVFAGFFVLWRMMKSIDEDDT